MVPAVGYFEIWWRKCYVDDTTSHLWFYNQNVLLVSTGPPGPANHHFLDLSTLEFETTWLSILLLARMRTLSIAQVGRVESRPSAFIHNTFILVVWEPWTCSLHDARGVMKACAGIRRMYEVKASSTASLPGFHYESNICLLDLLGCFSISSFHRQLMWDHRIKAKDGQRHSLEINWYSCCNCDSKLNLWRHKHPSREYDSNH